MNPSSPSDRVESRHAAAVSFPREIQIVVYFDTRGDVYFCNEETEFVPLRLDDSQRGRVPIGRISVLIICVIVQTV